MNNDTLTRELIEVLGDEAACEFAGNFGGTRLYIPVEIAPCHEIMEAVGLEAATALQRRLGGATIRVPLMREMRALRLRRQGLSNAKIAVKLGITETGVDKMIGRLRAAGQIN